MMPMAQRQADQVFAPPASSPLSDNDKASSTEEGEPDSPFPTPSQVISLTSKRPRTDESDPKSAAKYPRKAARAQKSGHNPMPRILEATKSKQVDRNETSRLDKCKIIRFIDSNYAQKQEGLPPVLQVADEVCRQFPDLEVQDKSSGRMKPRDAKSVLRYIQNIVSRYCIRGTRLKEFCANPTGLLQEDGRLRYREYCASMGDSPAGRRQELLGEERLPPSSAHTRNQETAEIRDSMPSTSPGNVSQEPLQNRPSDKSQIEELQFPETSWSFEAMQNSHASGTRPTISSNFLPDRTRWTLDTGLLSAGFQGMFFRAKSCMHHEFAARGIADRRPAAFLLDPPASLRQLYDVIIGTQSVQTAKGNIVALTSAEDLALSLFGAFLLHVIFHGSCGEMFDDFQVKTNDAAQAKRSDAAYEINEVLKELRTDHDTVLRKAYFRLHLKQEWVQSTFGPIANKLSEDFAIRLEHHLRFRSAESGQSSSSGPLTHAAAGRFYTIIFDALVFKCKVSTAREKTKFTWYRGGDTIDYDFMEGFRGDRKHVVLTVFPGFELGDAGLDAEGEVISKAQIAS